MRVAIIHFWGQENPPLLFLKMPCALAHLGTYFIVDLQAVSSDSGSEDLQGCPPE